MKEITITLEDEELRIMNVIESITGVSCVDCFLDRETNTAYVVVEKGKVGFCIGKGGYLIKILENLLKKKIKVFEFDSDEVGFIKKLIPQAKDVKIEVEDGLKKAKILVSKVEKPVVLGRESRNLKIFKRLLAKSYGVREIEILTQYAR